MRGKRGIAYVVAVMLAITGCQNVSQEDTGKQGNSEGMKSVTRDSENDITVYCQEGVALFVNAVREYEQLTEVEVDLQLFESVEEMEDKITVETLSGGGPDVFFFCAENTSLDVHKMMKNGSFLALDKFIEQEKSYHGYMDENYYDCMLEAGRYDGKQYILPFSFNMMQFYIDKEIADTYYASVQNNCSMRELLQMIRSECSRTEQMEDYTGIWWTSFVDVEDKLLHTLLEQSQLSFMNYEEKIVDLDLEALEEMTEFYITLQNEYQRKENVEVKYGQQSEFLEHFSFMWDNGSLLDAVRYDVSLYGFYDKRPYVYLLSSWEEASSYTASICEYGAVNANSAQQQEAYDLLRFVMDYQVEYDFDRANANLSYNLPVNKKNLHSCMEMVKQLRGKRNKMVLPLREDYAEYAQQLEDVLEHIEMAVITNPKVGDIVEEVMRPYCEGEESFESCSMKLENRLKLYLSE